MPLEIKPGRISTGETSVQVREQYERHSFYSDGPVEFDLVFLGNPV